MFLYMGEALSWLTQAVPTLAHGVGSMRHLDDLLLQKSEPADPVGAVALGQFEHAIEFRDVSFAYPDGRFRVDNFNLIVPRGCHCSIVGGSGSGKSTILGLLLRLIEPQSGAILLDGQNLRNVTRASLRAQCAIVFQESFLFNTSIAENIAMGLEGATQDAIEAAARDAEIHDFIMSLPKGYETQVGERGGRLSVGQRQRIAIARALVRNPAILLLDEATSALDAETEAALLATLARVGRDRTVISVTHRLHSSTHADKIVVMDRGKLRESGCHDALLAGDGLYARLWKRKDKIPQPHQSTPSVESPPSVPTEAGLLF
jgi:ATP-binding cassette subfamily B protein